MMPDKVQAKNNPTPLNALLDMSRPADSVVAYRNPATNIQTLNWHTFCTQVRTLSAELDAYAETRWSLVCDDGVEFAIGLLALAQAGKTIILPQNPQQKIDNCDTLLSDNASYSPKLKTNADYSSGKNSFPAKFTNAKLGLYTSGSTGKQKCIPKTWQQLDNEIRTLEASFGQKLTNTAILGTVPHYHIYGLLFRILWPLTTGRPFISQPCLLMDEITAVVAKLPHIALISSPAHLKRLPTTPWPDTTAKKLVALFSSGGPLATNTARNLHQTTGQPPIEIYGSTETGGIAWRQQAQKDCWYPLPGVDTRVKDEILAVQSPWTENQAWVDTGDCAQTIDKNSFQLKGRSDGVIKIEDKRISLLALETLLTEHAFIASAKLLVLKQARQTIAAVCVLSNAGREILQQQGKNTLQTILRKHLAQHYELITLPRRWRFVDALPVNAIGKHDWQSLAEMFNKPDKQPAGLSLPKITQSERNGNSLRLSFTVTDEIKWFTGHFPNTPVLAGVVQIDWAIHFAQVHFGSPAGFQRMEKVKFQKLIVPEQNLTLVLEQKPDNTRIAFRYEYGEQTFSSGIIKLGGTS